MNKKLLALLMALVMVFSLLTGCAKSASKTTTDTDSKQDQEEQIVDDDGETDKDDKTDKDDEDEDDEEPADGVVGDWTANIDASDAMGGIIELGLSMAMGEELSGVKFDTSRLKANFVIDLSLYDDGSYSATIGEKNPGEMADSMMDMIEDSKDSLAEAAVKAMGMTRAEIEGALKEQGMTWDDFVDMMLEEMADAMDPDSMVIDSEEESGYYVIDGNKLYFLEDEDDNIDDAESYLEFALKGSKLVITGIGGDMDDLEQFEDIINDLLPIEFKKA